MAKAISSVFQLSLCTLGCLYVFNDNAIAQITPDGTVNTQVNQNGNVAEITGGETRGDNLFHSFQDFSVPTGNEAFFNNADSISNIFSRVTGGNISNIDGAIRANGSASLFLVNPAGIIFGKNSRLDIGGSFYGSTASSILFEDGEFSAADLENPPLLTVNAPIGLGFRDNPGDIINRSRVQNIDEEVVGLEISSGNNLAFIGGNLNFEAGNITVPGGNIYLGGLVQAGKVELNENGSLIFPQDVTLGYITLINAADVDVRSIGKGNITIDAQNLTLEAGEFGKSLIRGGIKPESTNSGALAGDLVISVVENIRLENSRIVNQVDPEGVGNSGNITIETGSIELINGGNVDASTSGTGDAGTIYIMSTGDITANGDNLDGFLSSINSGVSTGAEGDSGGITIATTNLNLAGGARINASTSGTGDAGAIHIIATEDITADGEQFRFSPTGIASGIFSEVSTGAEGDSGGVTITTTNLNLTEGARVNASTSGTGDAGAINIIATEDITADGDILDGVLNSGIGSEVGTGAEGNSGRVTITTTNLNLTGGGIVSASTSGTGNAGAINITATEDITVDGDSSFGFPSTIASVVDTSAEGDSGGITITTTNLNLTEGGQVNADTFGTGNAGAIHITATEDITVDGENIGSSPSGTGGIPSGIFSEVGTGAEGNSEGVIITTTNLNLIEGARVDASTFGTGNAGAIHITATEDITVDGETSFGFPSNIASVVDTSAEGNSGEIVITTTNLNLIRGARVDASTFGTGNAGAIHITATENITVDGENSGGFPSGIREALNVGISGGFPSGIVSAVGTGAEGNSGEIVITTTNLNLTGGGIVSASTSGTGNANNVTINAAESIFIDGFIEEFLSSISANALIENGSGGNIFITTDNLTIQNGGTIEATNFDNIGTRTSGTGKPGNITIEANSINLSNAARIEAATQSVPEEVTETEDSGIINLRVKKDITLRENSIISAQALNNADGGNLNIDSRFIIAFPSSGNGSDIIASAQQGNGGDIDINAESLFGIRKGRAREGNGTNDIDASSQFNLDGEVMINTPDVNPVQGATELSTNVIVPEETSQQACEANRELAAQNGLNITGKGGIVPDPASPLNSLNVNVNGESTSAMAIPAPIETAQGKIQLARGAEITESGQVILTAYRTNNTGERLPEIKRNCSSS